MSPLTKVSALALFILVLFTGRMGASDTLKLNLSSAEAVFLEQNLSLIARQYAIEMAEAMIIQARLWPNPELSLTEVTLFPQSRILEELPGGNWNLVAELEQLIETAGKRKSRIAIASSEHEMSRLAFEQLLHELRFAFREKYLQINYLDRLKDVYDEEIQLVEHIITTMEPAVEQRLATRLELTRLKSLLYGLRRDRLDISLDYNEALADFRALLALQPNTNLKLKRMDFYWQDIPKASVINFARASNLASTYRADLRFSSTQVNFAHAVLNFERAQAVPDFTLSMMYDRAGAFAQNYIGFGVSIDLPVFNRNQGNIQASVAGVAKAESLFRETENHVFRDVATALQHWQNIENEISQFDHGILDDYQSIMEHVRTQFINRHISLLEFLDFLESFREIQINWMELNQSYDLAGEAFLRETGLPDFDNL